LRRRLKKRIEKETVIAKRIKLAKKELQISKMYDYLIINQRVTVTLKILETILFAEGFRRG